WDFTPTGIRYYAECTMFGILPLVARGLAIAYARLRARFGKSAPRMAIAAAALLLLNTACSYGMYRPTISVMGPYYWALERAVREQSIHRAVIFIQGTEGPPGEYPFRSLQDIDIVYFRLGPDESWKLPPRNPGTVYDQYFRGRQAYSWTWPPGKLEA